MDGLKYLLLQTRNLDDPMREQEVRCFARALNCPVTQIVTHDLISAQPRAAQIDAVDVVLLGGSGDYSVVTGGPWLHDAMETFCWLYEHAKPTFASCWGFQAFARALGGRVVTDYNRAELGTPDLTLTDAGRDDPVLGMLDPVFPAPLGHKDIVDELPADAILLASSEKVENEAYTFPGKPIYCTQFHPELIIEELLERVRTYPTYVERIAAMSVEEFAATCRPVPGTSRLLERFIKVHFGE